MPTTPDPSAPAQPASAPISDRAKLQRALQELDGGTLVARARVGETQSAAIEAVYEAIAGRGGARSEYSAVFWHRQSDRAAFQDEKLVAPLHLHWFGDRARLVAELSRALGASAGWRLRVPEDDRGAFVVEPTPSDEAPDAADATAVLAYLNTQRARAWETEAGLAAPVLEQLRGIMRRSEPKLAMYAFFLLEPRGVDRDDIDAMIARVPEIAAVRPGNQSWQDPAHVLHQLLSAMERAEHPDAGALREAWASHKKKIFRKAIELHALYGG